jgi:hypothetical protein
MFVCLSDAFFFPAVTLFVTPSLTLFVKFFFLSSFTRFVAAIFCVVCSTCFLLRCAAVGDPSLFFFFVEAPRVWTPDHQTSRAANSRSARRKSLVGLFFLFALCALLYAWLGFGEGKSVGRREQAKTFLDLRPRSYGERTHVGGNDILYAQLYPSRASGVQIRDAVCGRPVGSFAPITTLHDVPDEPRWRLAPPLLRRLLSPFADYDAPTYGERGQRFGSSASKLGLY